MKPIRTCAGCGERTAALVREDYRTDLAFAGRQYALVAAGVPLYRCTNCGTVALTDEATEAVGRGLRTAAGLLAPDEIRHGREAAGWTVAELAARLAVPEPTVGRWESGGQLQSPSHDGRLRDFFGAVVPAPAAEPAPGLAVA